MLKGLLTWLQKMLREIGESPGSITSIFRKWKEQTAWSLVGGMLNVWFVPTMISAFLFVTIFALQLSPVGVTSQYTRYTTERTTNKQFTALTTLNTALLSLREYNKPFENDQFLQWIDLLCGGAKPFVHVRHHCAGRYGNVSIQLAIWQVWLIVWKREICHSNRYQIHVINIVSLLDPTRKNRCTSPQIKSRDFSLG